jgi:hypothetical protein
MYDNEDYDTRDGRLPTDLVLIARGEAPLRDAFLTLSYYGEVQAQAAKELFEREVWAVTALIEESIAIWNHLTSPTLQFRPDGSGPEQYRLELGRFAHLVALSAPTEGERALIAAALPCWARVARHPERELSGSKGPLGCSYEPISVAEAVATLGFRRIQARIEAATREAGAALVAEAQSQEERRAQLISVERMLGWQSEAAPVGDRTRLSRMLLAFITHDRCMWLVAAAFLALLVIPLCIVVGVPLASLATVSSVGLFIWRCWLT